MFPSLACSFSNVCSGCDWLARPYDDQRALKLDDLRSYLQRALPSRSWIEIDSCEWSGIREGGLRDRADLTIDQRSGTYRVGLLNQNRDGIIDLDHCPQMSTQLENWLRDFRRIQIPVQRGSIRLRVSPSGKRGVWLDLANVDIKSLLDQRIQLDALRSQAVVEIGQRRKRLIEREGQLKLSDPVLEPWFETYLHDENTGQATAVPLFCSIGTFTQPGFDANRALVRKVHDFIRPLEVLKAVEFGSGIGNFTVPLAAMCEQVDCYEVDELALAGMRRSLEECGLESKVTIHSGNFQVSKNDPLRFSGVDLIFVDPPRSGLKEFIEPLEALPSQDLPPHFVYISCFAESFSFDTARLMKMNYQLARLAIVDQFPQSRHYEIVALFSQDRS
jgi:23S rRNA (uracil1939-C5)-methyltransferase